MVSGFGESLTTSSPQRTLRARASERTRAARPPQLSFTSEPSDGTALTPTGRTLIRTVRGVAGVRDISTDLVAIWIPSAALRSAADAIDTSALRRLIGFVMVVCAVYQSTRARICRVRAPTSGDVVCPKLGESMLSR